MISQLINHVNYVEQRLFGDYNGQFLTKFFIKRCLFCCLNSSCVAVREAVQEW